jgi:hypothetical protein
MAPGVALVVRAEPLVAPEVAGAVVLEDAEGMDINRRCAGRRL